MTTLTVRLSAYQARRMTEIAEELRIPVIELGAEAVRALIRAYPRDRHVRTESIRPALLLRPRPQPEMDLVWNGSMKDISPGAVGR
jgi:type III secretory pathway component EscU